MCFMGTSCLDCEHHFHRGLRSSDHCWFVCSSCPSVCCVIVSYTIVSCNRTTHTAASPGAQALFPAHVPTWHSCQGHGSVPWQAIYHLHGTSCECRTEGWNCANWGSSNYCGCPLFGCGGGAFPPVQWEPEVHLQWTPYVTQIHNSYSLHCDR